MKALFAILLFPAMVHAAPSGSQVCYDKTKSVKVVFGTYAVSGPPVVITIAGMDFLLKAEYGETGSIYTSKNQGAMCACGQEDGPQTGSGVLKITGDTPESATQAFLSATIKMPWYPQFKDVEVKDLELSCEPQDYTPGGEQN